MLNKSSRRISCARVKKGLETQVGCLEADPPPDELDRQHSEDEADPRANDSITDTSNDLNEVSTASRIRSYGSSKHYKNATRAQKIQMRILSVTQAKYKLISSIFFAKWILLGLTVIPNKEANLE